mmetsp:Transcript_14695/g.38937  ORF Transcript_14695/g.38937 Transcript_14695/m.38937 type:complete len:232 (+) Transcript_14695:628-1323(+)
MAYAAVSGIGRGKPGAVYCSTFFSRNLLAKPIDGLTSGALSTHATNGKASAIPYSACRMASMKARHPNEWQKTSHGGRRPSSSSSSSALGSTLRSSAAVSLRNSRISDASSGRKLASGGARFRLASSAFASCCRLVRAQVDGLGGAPTSTGGGGGMLASASATSAGMASPRAPPLCPCPRKSNAATANPRSCAAFSTTSYLLLLSFSPCMRMSVARGLRLYTGCVGRESHA